MGFAQSLSKRIKGLLSPPDAPRIEWGQYDLSLGNTGQSITPEKVASLIRSAEQGDMSGLLAFEDEMIARDPHLQALVSTSVDYLLEATFAVMPYPSVLRRESQKGSGEAKRAQLIADYIEEELRRPEVRLDTCIRTLGGGFGRGIGGVQPVVEAVSVKKEGVPGKLERLVALQPVPYQRFGFRPETGQILVSLDGSTDKTKLKTLDELGSSVVVLVADQEIVNPARRGYLRAVLAHWLVRNLGLGWWSRFVELYGVPFRQGTYPQGDDDSRRALMAVCREAGNAAYAVLPEGARLDIVDTFQRISGHSPHQSISEFTGREMSKVILGHAHAIEVQQGTGSVQGSKASDVIALRRTNARGLQIAQALRNQLVFGMVARSFSIEDAYLYTPEIQIVLEQRDSMQLVATAMDTLVKAGLRSIPVIEVHKLVGIRVAEPGEPTLQPIPMPGQPTPEAVGMDPASMEPVSKPMDDPAKSDVSPDQPSDAPEDGDDDAELEQKRQDSKKGE